MNLFAGEHCIMRSVCQTESYIIPLLYLKVLLTSPLVLTAPQYGGNSFQSGSQSAPAQSQSVQCRTENQVVWDTKYVETETQVSRMVPTSRHVR